VRKQRGRVLHPASPLPLEAQLAPVYGNSSAGTLDGDGKPDLLLAGNFDGVQPAIGRMSASYGLVLRGDGNWPIHPAQDGGAAGFQRPRAGPRHPGGCGPVAATSTS